MKKLRINYLITIVILFGSLPFMQRAIADTFTYVDDTGKRSIQNVLVIYQTDDMVQYLSIQKGTCLETRTVYRAKDIKVTFSSDEEKSKLLDSWRKQTSSAILTRSLGPSVNIAAYGVTYPLPENVTYIMGSPAKVQGPWFYVGKDSSSASKVFFRDVQSVDIQNDGATARIMWRNSQSSEGDILPSWRYGDRLGAPALLFGIDMDTLSFIEIPLKDVRRLVVTGHKTVRCSGDPMHSFVEPPAIWKFCPVCGKTLQTPAQGTQDR